MASESALDQYARIFKGFLVAQDTDEALAGELCGQLDDLWYAMTPEDRERADAHSAAAAPLAPFVSPSAQWAQDNAGFLRDYNERVAQGGMMFHELRRF